MSVLESHCLPAAFSLVSILGVNERQPRLVKDSVSSDVNTLFAHDVYVHHGSPASRLRLKHSTALCSCAENQCHVSEFRTCPVSYRGNNCAARQM